MGLELIMLEVEVGASIDRVWQAWAEPNKLTAWLTERTNTCVEVGGRTLLGVGPP